MNKSDFKTVDQFAGKYIVYLGKYSYDFINKRHAEDFLRLMTKQFNAATHLLNDEYLHAERIYRERMFLVSERVFRQKADMIIKDLRDYILMLSNISQESAQERLQDVVKRFLTLYEHFLDQARKQYDVLTVQSIEARILSINLIYVNIMLGESGVRVGDVAIIKQKYFVRPSAVDIEHEANERITEQMRIAAYEKSERDKKQRDADAARRRRGDAKAKRIESKQEQRKHELYEESKEKYQAEVKKRTQFQKDKDQDKQKTKAS